MSYELPKRKHIVMKAIEPKNLSMSAFLEAADRATWTEIKYDGCCAVLIKQNGAVYQFNRQGNVVDGCLDHIAEAMHKGPGDNYVFFMEAYHPDLIFSVINGSFRKAYSGLDAVVGEAGKYPALFGVVFDMVTLEEFERGESQVPYLQRRRNYIERVTEIKEGLVNTDPLDLSRFLDVAEGSNNKEDLMIVVDSYREGSRPWGESAHIGAIFNKYEPLVFPTDGYIKRDPNAPWVAGAGSEGYTLKDKDKLTVDLVIEGIIEGQGKFVGMVGALTATYKGQAQRIQGGSLTDKQRKAMFKDPSLIVGKVWEVHALAESTTGLLREPRLSHERTDKDASEADQ